MAFLEGPSAKQAEVIKQELGEHAGELERGIRDLRSMCAANPNLPPPQSLDSSFLALFLRGCRMDFERARNKLELYCVARSRCRDLFEYRSLNEPPLNDVCKFIDIVPLPKLTDEGHRVTIFRIKPDYPECSADLASLVKAILLVADARMHDETLILGDVFIWEVSHVRLSIAARMAAGANVIRRAMHLAHAAYPQRMRRIHIVGAPATLASSINLIRSWGNEKIRQRYQIHSKVEDLLDYFPARVLPSEWGGKEKSFEELSKMLRLRIDELREYLRELNEICQDTSDNNFNNDLYGAIGSFRKLDID